MAKEEKEFNFVNLPSECNDPEIKKEDFKLVQTDAKIYDQKFETKPTTFFKDCLKRFAKNKSSVVAAFILGILIILSVFVPIIFKTSEVHETGQEHVHPDIYYLEPKLFPAGTGFWDGTKKMTDIVATKDPDTGEWVPARYPMNAVSNLDVQKEQYTSTPNEYAHGGYVQFGYFNNIPADVEYVTYASDADEEYFPIAKYDFKESLKVTNFETLDLAKLGASDEETKEYPAGYVEAESALYFKFNAYVGVGVPEDEEALLVTDFYIPVTEYKKAHSIGAGGSSVELLDKFQKLVEDYNDDKTDDKDKLNGKIAKPSFEIRVKNSKTGENACTLIKSFEVESGSINEKTEFAFEKYSFKDGNEVYTRLGIYNSIANTNDEELKAKKEANSGIWKKFSSNEYSKETSYLVRAVLCSFTYDTYEAVLGTVKEDVYTTDLETLLQKGVIDYYIPVKKVNDVWTVVEEGFYCTILKPDECPFFEPFTAKDVVLRSDSRIVDHVVCHVYGYKKYYNLDSMPIFLLGTSKDGWDMFIYVFEGLRTSLLLGVATTVVCFLFGLFWGAVSGYFGGTVDLAMERLTDILSGVPWIVVMTLTIIHLGSNFFTFALALCLTGWIGTAATTRTQFYRFRGREYVLASRTLGASHARLISRHILPNAMGTIITSAVLMVPSVIFSEATISYLGLGFQNLASLGVILSDNQVELTNHPYLLIFPAIIIALLMISFNLFGNGLRDAVNPSLKGEGE